MPARHDRARDAAAARRAGPVRGVTRAISVTFIAVAEDSRVTSFRARFDAGWPSYQAWFLQARATPPGPATSPAGRRSARTCRSWCRPTSGWCELAGGGDMAPACSRCGARRRYLSACTQAVVRGPRTVLVRNYDYDVNRFEAVIVRTGYAGPRCDRHQRLPVGPARRHQRRRPRRLDHVRRPPRGRRGASASRSSSATCSRRARPWPRRRRRSPRLPVHMAYNVTVIDAPVRRRDRLRLARAGRRCSSGSRWSRTTRTRSSGRSSRSPLAPRDREVACSARCWQTGWRDERRWFGRSSSRRLLARLRALLRHAVHGGLPAGRAVRRLPVAGLDLAPVVHRLHGRRTHRRPAQLKRYRKASAHQPRASCPNARGPCPVARSARLPRVKIVGV